MLLQQIVISLKHLPKELLVVIVAVLPIAELRGALPLAIILGESAFKAFWLSVLGNILPVIPLLFLLEPVSRFLRKWFLFRRFFDWFFERTKKKAALVQRYEALGLMLFVAVPLPMTGAWAGCVCASLFKIRFRYAVAAICGGVLIAGCIVLVLTLLGKGMVNYWINIL